MQSEGQGAWLLGRWRGREPRNAGGLRQLRGPSWQTARNEGSQSCNHRGLDSARDRESKAVLSSRRERSSQHVTSAHGNCDRMNKRRFQAPSPWPFVTSLETSAACSTHNEKCSLRCKAETVREDASPGRHVTLGAGVKHHLPAVTQVPQRGNATDKPTRAFWTGLSTAALASGHFQ